MLNENGDTCTLNENKKSLLLYIDEHACHICLESLSEFITHTPIDTAAVPLLLLTNIPEEPLQKRLHLLELKKYYPKARIFFDIGTQGIKQQITVTPAIMLIQPEHRQLIEYKDIFNGYEISPSAKATIQSFISR